MMSATANQSLNPVRTALCILQSHRVIGMVLLTLHVFNDTPGGNGTVASPCKPGELLLILLYITEACALNTAGRAGKTPLNDRLI